MPLMADLPLIECHTGDRIQEAREKGEGRIRISRSKKRGGKGRQRAKARKYVRLLKFIISYVCQGMPCPVF